MGGIGNRLEVALTVYLKFTMNTVITIGQTLLPLTKAIMKSNLKSFWPNRNSNKNILSTTCSYLTPEVMT